MDKATMDRISRAHKNGQDVMFQGIKVEKIISSLGVVIFSTKMKSRIRLKDYPSTDFRILKEQ